MQESAKGYHAIDVTKFICSILVIMIHVAPLGESESIIQANFFFQNYLARIAVPFFFVCSGFFLYKKTAVGDICQPTKKYVKHLLRLYLLWTVLYFPLAFKDFFYDEKGIVHAVTLYVRNFIIEGSYMHLWYLNASIIAVLLVSAMLRKNIRPRYIIYIASVLYIIGLLGQSWFGLVQPLRNFPEIWRIFDVLQKLFVTTRNGLFDGFLFVSIGMLFAYKRIRISKRQSLIGLCISMILLLIEVYVLEYAGFIRAYDMYISLIPVSIYVFSFLSQTQLPDHPIYITLRHISALVYYLHLWMYFVIDNIFKTFAESSMDSWLVFILTALCTVIISYGIIELSSKKQIRCLKKLYV